MTASYRLITRGDFDGVVCAALLRSRGLVGPVSFARPGDMQDGRVAVDGTTITANLPWVAEAHLVFDHHSSERERTAGTGAGNHVNDPAAASAARVILEHYGGAQAFPDIPAELLTAVDRADAAEFSREEILDPTGWALLSFLLDTRTGLERFRDFRTPHEELLHRMIDLVGARPVEALLLDRDLSERVRLYFEQEAYFRAQLLRCTRLEGDVAVVDLRGEETLHAGNRFMVYALFPDARLSVHCLREAGGITEFALGRSILDRSSTVDVGRVCLAHGGGGHARVGSCRVPDAVADATLADLLAALGTP